MKQKITLTLTQQFKIPTSYAAWCHPCKMGFKTIADIQGHIHQVHLGGVPGQKLPLRKNQSQDRVTSIAKVEEGTSSIIQMDKTLDYGPPCIKCGSIMEHAGSCYTCPTCGDTSGCS